MKTLALSTWASGWWDQKANVNSWKGFLIFQSKQPDWTCAMLTTFIIRLCPCGCIDVAVLYCACLSPSFLRRVWERWHYCCGSCLLRLSVNLTPACLQALAEGHFSNAECSIQGQSSKLLNTTMCWQRDILTMRTMTRAELCILISWLF